MRHTGEWGLGHQKSELIDRSVSAEVVARRKRVVNIGHRIGKLYDLLPKSNAA